MRFEELHWTNSFTEDLPADPSDEIRSRPVSDASFSLVTPTPVADPRLLAVSSEMAEALDLDLGPDAPADVVAVLAGNRVPEGAVPHAARYGGHQFGNWAGQLGDGRAITLGEVRASSGDRWSLQLKGAGPTPYSRRADGRAVLRSSVREFLCSEAMHHLGVPTTRALSLVTTGDGVVRDMFYDGNPEVEPGAVVCRVSPSWVRFGTFEIYAASGELDLLRRVTDHVLVRDFPELGAPAPAAYAEMFAEVARRTADMVVHWQRVGFVHGVMNTDNMSILGLTIDYGPYGWLEGYDPDWTPNTTDAQGRRYRFGNQPQIALWNLVRLANALFPLIDDEAPLRTALDGYGERVDATWRATVAAKLGLAELGPSDADLVDDLWSVLSAVETDYTIFFRNLADVAVAGVDHDVLSDAEMVAPVSTAWYPAPDEITAEHRSRMASWLRSYGARVGADGTSDDVRRKRMNEVNPRFVLRNYLAQEAIDRAAAGDPSLIAETLDVLRRPYDDQPGREHFAEKRPEWARVRPGCSMLSCSS